MLGGGTLAAPHTPWSLDNLGHSHKNGVYTHAVGIFQALVNHNPCSNELHGIVYTVYRFIGDLEKIETFILHVLTRILDMRSVASECPLLGVGETPPICQ